MRSDALDRSAVPPLYLIISPSLHISVILISTSKHPSTQGAAPAADEKDNAKKEKKEKKEKTPAAAVTVVAAVEELDPSKLDIRVGEIKKCWNHEDSEKLLCEEVVGEWSIFKSSAISLHG